MPERDEDRRNDETQPLLENGSLDGGEGGDARELVEFGKNDPGDPRKWSNTKKMLNVTVIASMAVLSPLASSMFTPGIDQIADGLNTTTDAVIACTTGFVIMLGIGPLILAPLSETFGRRPMYLICFGIFALLQIPSALAPNIATLIASRTLAGFFGSVGIANGGGSLSDMFEPSQRAGVFGWYLLGPLLGPTLGPLFGGVIVQRLDWRWIFWILTIICILSTVSAYFFLVETYAPVILAQRKARLEIEHGTSNAYRFPGEDDRSLPAKLRTSLTRPLRILIQPIVLTMSIYQAIIFATTYSIYTNMQAVYQGEYDFTTEQVGLLYLGPGLGFLTCVWFVVPRIDTVYNRLTARNNGKGHPEYRLPLANIGSVLIPVSLFWFAWTVELHAHWTASIAATFFYGIGQVIILNTTTNYYIDCFEQYAASAIAAGAVFRSVVGGIIPLFAPTWFEKLGYGWGVSVFGFLSVVIAPAPAVFYFYGGVLREKFAIQL
ncbi:MFS general substrate transporter like protein [Zymoseptoria brevis]|uniref:Cercosporin MFS transporter CTB4 n=1 Tax=Zymoseptoria brevis TaxID=1047168 RepID=A0A0F4GSA0_9PEZI|nr:MFS general substrate transporter like protein [Zymoseptoria brevis]